MFVDAAGMTDFGKVQEHCTDQFLIAELNKSVVINRSSLPIEHVHRIAAMTAGHLLLVSGGPRTYEDFRAARDHAIVNAVEYVLVLLPWFVDAVRGSADTSTRLTCLVESASTTLPPTPSSGYLPLSSDAKITIAFLIWPTLYAVQCGSNGLYVLRGGKLHHIAPNTANDDSRQESSFSPVPSPDHNAMPSRISVRESLGRVHVHQTTLSYGDTVLLCTEGFTANLTDAEVAAILGEGRPADNTCVRLIQAAKDSGTVDDICVVVARPFEH